MDTFFVVCFGITAFSLSPSDPPPPTFFNRVGWGWWFCMFYYADHFPKDVHNRVIFPMDIHNRVQTHELCARLCGIRTRRNNSYRKTCIQTSFFIIIIIYPVTVRVNQFPCFKKKNSYKCWGHTSAIWLHIRVCEIQT